MWSDVHSALSDAPLHRAFVSVRDDSGPVGAGVLISPTRVLTCAHVVNSALRRDRFESSLPSRAQPVNLRLPLVDRDRVLTGRIDPRMWCPPRSRAADNLHSPPPAGMLPYYGDLAVLELDGEAPDGAEPAPFLAQRDGNEVVALWASGHALPTLRAVPRAVAHPWIALDVLGGDVTEGFSGGPLWDRHRQAVTGLVVAVHRSPVNAAEQAPAVMYAIGLSSIEAELPDLPPVDVPAAGRGRQQLLAVLERLLPAHDAVTACEERLAARLGRASAGPAADVDRLVGLAVGVRRGVPELLNIVYDQLSKNRDTGGVNQGADWNKAVRIARLVSPRELLSSKQRRNLNALLTQCRRTDPIKLLRTVLPQARELPEPCDLADATDVLERYDVPAAGSLPPLLQGVVHISTQERLLAKDLSEDLDAWADTTAPRLGVPSVLVEQARAEAHAARQAHASPLMMAAAPPRIQIELLPLASGRMFTYQIWVWTPDGRHEVVLTQDTEVSSRHVVQSIRQVLRTEVAEYPETALVEFFVAPAWFRLDVDAWEHPASDQDIGFRPGIARRVVLRSSERTRETYAGWRRRSSALGSSRRMLLDHRSTDPLVAQARLEVEPEAGIVVVCCDERRQGLILRQCIQAGVHTVLWNREGHGPEVADDLLALVADVEPADIPEAVRLERAKALADPECIAHRGRSLSLLHDGPDYRPPPLAPDTWALTQPPV